MNPFKRRSRHFFSVLLSLSLLCGTIPPSVWAGAGRDIAGESFQEPAPLPLNIASLENFKGEIGGIGALSGSETRQDSLSNAVQKSEGAVSLEKTNSDQTELTPGVLKTSKNSRLKNKLGEISKTSKTRLAAWKKSFKKIGSGLQKALSRSRKEKDFSASKNWLDRLFGEKTLNSRESASTDSNAASQKKSRKDSASLSAAHSQKIASETSVPEASSPDVYGGPSYKKMSLGGKIIYGVKWGLIFQGATHLSLMASNQVFQSSWFQNLRLNWLSHLSPAQLQSRGYGELLIHDGPRQIVNALVTHASSFLSWQLFLKSALEEIHYRGFVFGGVFLSAAALAYVLKFSADKLKYLPDFFSSLKNRLPPALNFIGKKLSQNAFLIAALSSAVLFSRAHMALWGNVPLFLAQQAAAGLVLAFVVYRSRSLISSSVAHYVHNFLWLFGIWLAATFTQAPVLSKDYGLALSAASLGLIGFEILKSLAPILKKVLYQPSSFGVSMGGRAIKYAKRLAPLVLIAAALSFYGSRLVTPLAPIATSAAPIAIAVPFALPQAPAHAADLSPEEIVAMAKPAVIKVYSGDGQGLGSGYIIAPSGIALTNAHVVGNVQPGAILKALIAGIPSEVEVLAVNHEKDIAILRLPGLPKGVDYPFIAIARTVPAIGEKVVALGYPYDVGLTATRGIVSRLGHGPEFFYDYVQTDAALNPGNSGGPLLNSKGELVGMDVAIYTPVPSGGSVGIGFAIAANEILSAVSQYQEMGMIDYASLGAVVDFNSEAGVKVELVRPDSPAQKAKLLPGDVIKGLVLIPIGGSPIVIDTPDAPSFERALIHLRSGDRAILLVRRGTQGISLKIVFGASPDF